MKTKFFLAAVAVALSFTMTSCGGNKTTNSETGNDSVSVEVVEAAADCCHADSTTCDKTAACDSTKECCKDKAACEQKTDCPDKANCEKKACDKK